MIINCHPCGEPLEVNNLAEVEDHIRVIHPDLYEPVEKWPDGAPVIYDETRMAWLNGTEDGDG